MSGDRCRCKSTGVASRSAEEFVRCHTWLRVRTLAGEKNNFCDAQTHISKERRASARRGCEYRNCNGVRFRRERCSSARRGSGKRTCKGALAKSRETTGGELTNAGAVAVAEPRGLTPPALVLRVRTLAGEKNNFCDAQMHISKERRASARRGLTYCNCNGVRFRRERRSSARRGYGNSFAETQARLFGGPPTAYVRVAVALAVNSYHGRLTPPAPDVPYDVGPRTWPRSPSLLRPKPRGLTPPALVLRCEHLSAKRQHAPC
jgi:hypothetical protein